MRRTILGIIALVLTVAGATLFFEWIPGSEQAGGIFFKAGLGLAAIWLAMPSIEGLFVKSNKSWYLFIGGMLALFVWPKAFFVLAPVLIALGVVQFIHYLFKPLPKNRS